MANEKRIRYDAAVMARRSNPGKDDALTREELRALHDRLSKGEVASVEALRMLVVLYSPGGCRLPARFRS